MSIPSPKTLLKRLGLRPKKSLGQHFLLYPHQARRIVAALDLGSRETVVEIGPGLGALTVLLAEAAGRVVALEVDQALSAFLKEELFSDRPGVAIICEDVLKFDFLKVSQEFSSRLKVVGNLPYQITSPLFFKLIQEKSAISRAVLMVQEEVGARLLANPGSKDYGILTVLVRYHFKITRLFTLSPNNFYPPPQVKSVVLLLDPLDPEPKAADENIFSRVVKTAFSQRRKTLKNTLAAQAAVFHLRPDELVHILHETEIDPGRRAETLSIGQFVELSNKIQVRLKNRRAG